MTWRPGQRAQARALEAPYDDVPNHLRQPLWSWAQTYLNDPEVLVWVGIALRLHLPDPRGSWHNAVKVLSDRCTERPDTVLDIIELLLGRLGWSHDTEKLDRILSIGNSAYAVRGDYRGLEMRVLPEVKDQVQAVVNAAAGSPGQHLANAWSEAYGRNADPVKAYSEAIKAVEAAGAPVISPQNLRATLGTLIKDVEAKPSKWTFTISSADGADTVLRLMKLLWQGQTSRHGGVQPTRAETVEEARAAVHLTATLVQFFVGKSFR